jgi:hypothetical protein
VKNACRNRCILLVLDDVRDSAHYDLLNLLDYRHLNPKSHRRHSHSSSSSSSISSSSSGVFHVGSSFFRSDSNVSASSSSFHDFPSMHSMQESMHSITSNNNNNININSSLFMVLEKEEEDCFKPRSQVLVATRTKGLIPNANEVCLLMLLIILVLKCLTSS